jgi:N-methylhydantoinase A
VSAGPSIVAGVDVGGTFTDVFYIDERSGAFGTSKVPTDIADRARGCVAGLRAAVPDLAQLAMVINGTTAGTNALLERRGAVVGMIATRGFGDVLEMRRRDRPQLWGLRGHYESVVPRNLIVEVDERTMADGTIRTPVPAADVEAAARRLRKLGAEVLCIVFINAYVNATNERQAREAAQRAWPGERIVVSSEILPEIREFERASTTALNAYLQPVIERYVSALGTSLASHGFAGEILIVQSNGGVMSVEDARRLPIRTALSGPAAGVTAAAFIARAAGFPNVITCDMGGTSFDVSVVANGAHAMVPQAAIDFGLVIRSPMIEIATIGAGGGSIASIDRSGLLQIGPESAGADPGPVCYGLGNDRPTVTDANVVLGRIDPERPIGGKLARLDVDAAREAIRRCVGDPLGIDPIAAAGAIVRVANSRMAGAIRLVSIERGHDPRTFALLAFGGGASLHVGALMRDVGVERALIPRYPGVTSALGCVLGDVRYDYVQTINRGLIDLDVAAFEAQFRGHADAGLARLAARETFLERTETRLEVDMSYEGQFHTVGVPLPNSGLSREVIGEAFAARYAETYGRLLDGVPLRILSMRTAVIGVRRKFDLRALAPSGNEPGPACVTGMRTTWIDGRAVETPVYDRLRLSAGSRIAGPAILEQPDTTIYVDPELAARVDAFGNIVLEAATGREAR